MVKPTVLIVIDGYGINKQESGNAIAMAKTPNMDALQNNYPNTILQASGETVGLERGQISSPETGYLNLGAGRTIDQGIKIINNAIKDGSLFRNPQLIDLIKYVKEKNRSLHLIGMLSDAGIQSHINHLFSLLELAHHHFIEKVYMHLILDGRDVETASAKKYLRQLEKFLERNNAGTVATVIGRHYAMDKSKKALRVRKTYDMLIKGKGILIRDPMEAVNSAYKRRLSDEYVEPTIINQGGIIKDKDAIIFFNLGSHQASTLIHSLVDPHFKAFPVKKMNLKFVSLVCLQNSPYTCAYHIPLVKNTLGETLSAKKLRQVIIAEEENFVTATRFFNGGNLHAWPKQDLIMVPSPHVPSFDKKPEMAARQITKQAINQIKKGKHEFVMVSFANLDSVGHTGKLKETIKATEIVDKCIGEIVQATEKKKGTSIITSPHGNAETMEDKFGRPVTANTAGMVPCIITRKGIRLKPGKLADIAPTVLKLMKIRPPQEMKGKSLY